MATTVDVRPPEVISRQNSPNGHQAPQPKWTRRYRVRQLLSPLKVPTSQPGEVEVTPSETTPPATLAVELPAPIARNEGQISNVSIASRSSSPVTSFLPSHRSQTQDEEDGAAAIQYAGASSKVKGKAAVPCGGDFTISREEPGPQYLGDFGHKHTPNWHKDVGSGQASSSAAGTRNSASEGDSGYGSSNLPEQDLNVVDSGNELQQPKNSHLFAQDVTSTSTSGSNPSTAIHDKSSRLGSRNPYRKLSHFDGNAKISQAPIDEIKPASFESEIQNELGAYPGISPNEGPYPNRLATFGTQQPPQGIVDPKFQKFIENYAIENNISRLGETSSSLNGTPSWLKGGNVAPLEAGTTCPQTRTVESTVSRCSNITFDITQVERLSRECYMAPREAMPNAVVQEWNQTIKPQLDQVLQELMKSDDVRREVVLTNVQLCMVISKQGGTLRAEPTIVITCGTKSCTKRIKKRLGKLKLHCLVKFGAPIKIRFHPSPAYWAASTITATTFGGIFLNLHELIIENHENFALDSGAEMTFIVSRDGEQGVMRSTLGGIVYIDGAFYGMTTAHTFLAQANEDYSSQHDWRMPSVSHRHIRSTLSGSDLLGGLAYSFLGQVGRTNSVCATATSTVSDWALIAIGDLMKPYGLASLDTFQLTSVRPQSQLVPGEVEILYKDFSGVTGKYHNFGRFTGFLTQPNVSFHTKDMAMNVREIILIHPLPNNASGSWVTRDNELYGYIVASTASRRSAFMIPMENAFCDIENVFGRRLMFGKDLLESLERDKSQNMERNGTLSGLSSSPLTPDIALGPLKPKSPNKLESHYEEQGRFSSMVDRLSAAEKVNKKAIPYRVSNKRNRTHTMPKKKVRFLSFLNCCSPREDARTTRKVAIPTRRNSV